MQSVAADGSSFVMMATMTLDTYEEEFGLDPAGRRLSLEDYNVDVSHCLFVYASTTDGFALEETTQCFVETLPLA